MNKRISLLIFAICVCCLVGCAKNVANATVEYAVADEASGMVFSAKRAALTSNAMLETVAASNVVQEQKIVKNGSINVEVDNLKDAEDVVADWVKKYSGYVSNTHSTKTSVSITAKIPTEKFNDAMNEAGTFGRVQNRSIYTDDVTDQYYDLETRLKNRKIFQEKLQDYLKSAKDITELLKIENQLNSVTSEIESMESQFKNLNTRIDYATINVECFLPNNTTDEGFDKPNFVNYLKDFGHKALYFFSGFGIAILYIIIYGTPLVLLAALLFWLTFGKLGLVKKLFKKLK